MGVQGLACLTYVSVGSRVLVLDFDITIDSCEF
jgi:hypothetical protein